MGRLLLQNMRIAVNAIFLQTSQLEGYGHYAHEVFSRLAKQHPEHEFLFLFDRAFDQKFVSAQNITPLVVSPKARHPLAFKYWYDVAAPLALRNKQVDVWVQPYGFTSLATRTPQVLLVHDLAFLHYPQFVPWYHRRYYQWFTPRFLKKAKSVVTVSDYTRQDILNHYQLPAEKIHVVKGAARQCFAPISWQEKEQVKDGYADGMEYFLFTGGIHPRKNLLNLLKAFSLFKKWQHSNMKLLVAGRLAWQYDDVLTRLKTYKYRNDVVLLDYVPEEQLAKLTAAAYALVYPSFFEGFGLPIVEAMQSEVPVITSNTSSMPEIGGDAVLYADPTDPEAIAKQMLNLYRDEASRARLITAGKEQAARFSWDTAAAQLWEVILAAAAK
jgi:glycosyltransferase involved in cell wall biosynthesis